MPEQMEIPQGVPKADGAAAPKKPRAAKPGAGKSTGKIVVIEQVCEDNKIFYLAAAKQPMNLRRKEQLHAWISKNLGAGVFAAIKIIVKTENVVETKEIKTSKML